MRRALDGCVLSPCMTASEVEQLCEVIPLDLCGSVFVPWKCSDGVVEVLRSNGCRVRFSMEKEDVRCVEEKSFEKAKSDGVFNGVALLDVSPEMADVALPAASKHSSVCVAAKLPWEYVTQADSARLKWLRSMQREQKLGVIPCGNCDLCIHDGAECLCAHHWRSGCECVHLLSVILLYACFWAEPPSAAFQGGAKPPRTTPVRGCVRACVRACVRGLVLARPESSSKPVLT